MLIQSKLIYKIMSDAWHIVINKIACYCCFIIILIKKETENKEQIVLNFLTLKIG